MLPVLILLPVPCAVVGEASGASSAALHLPPSTRATSGGGGAVSSEDNTLPAPQRSTYSAAYSEEFDTLDIPDLGNEEDGDGDRDADGGDSAELLAAQHAMDSAAAGALHAEP